MFMKTIWIALIGTMLVVASVSAANSALQGIVKDANGRPVQGADIRIEETTTALNHYILNPSIENFAEVADGIVDTIYVLCQLGRVLGVPLDAVWDEVQAANMRKVGADGKVLRREDGKILKPEGWKPPAVWDICYAEYVKKMQREQGSKALGD